jgi:hypothetical protein
MLLDESLSDKQSQAGAMRLGRKIGPEHFLLVFGANPRTVIANSQPQFTGFDSCRDMDVSTGRRGINGIKHQIQQSLYQLVLHHVDLRQIRGQVGGDRLAASRLVILSDIECLLHDVGHRRPDTFPARRSAEINQLAENGLDALQLLIDQGELLLDSRVADASLEQLDEGTDGGQGIAYFMGDSCRQQTKCSHFLLLQQTCLGLLQLASSLLHPGLEGLPLVFQFGIQPPQPLSRFFQPGSQRIRRPAHPAHQHQTQQQLSGIFLAPGACQIQHAKTRTVQAKGDVRYHRLITQRANNQRQQIVVTKRAVHSRVVVAQHSNEEGLQQRNDQRIPLRQHPAPQGCPGIPQRISQTQQQNAIEHRPVGERRRQVDPQQAQHHANPADFQDDGFRSHGATGLLIERVIPAVFSKARPPGFDANRFCWLVAIAA